MIQPEAMITRPEGEPAFSGEVSGVSQRASTGSLPHTTQVQQLIEQAHARYQGLDRGEVADYIPALGRANPDWFGLNLVDVTGRSFGVGDTDIAFTIQSISKAFVFALACQEHGHEFISDKIGVNNSGFAFNSVIAIELNDGSPMNPMVNAGAMSTTELLPGATPEQKWEYVLQGLSAFAGRELRLNHEVYESESATNSRNLAIARLLYSYGRLEVDPDEITDLYTRQCALSVNAYDLAVMGATLADGGVNPITGQQVVSAEVCRDTLALLASCGMYQFSGEWLYEIGLPAKSGVSGGIVAVAPGKGAVGTFSPRLDAAGNSIRGQRACAHLSRALGLNVFASTQMTETD